MATNEYSPEMVAFITKAIKAWQSLPGQIAGGYKGMHVVYSEFNKLFHNKFACDLSVQTGTDERGRPIYGGPLSGMIADGLFEGHPVKGGFMVYLVGEMRKSLSASGRTLADAMADE